MQHPNFSWSRFFIVLLLLGFLDVKMEYDHYDQVVSSEVDGSSKYQKTERNSTVSLRTELTTKISIKTYRVLNKVKPQDVSVIIRVHFESRRVNSCRYLLKNSSTLAL